MVGRMLEIIGIVVRDLHLRCPTSWRCGFKRFTIIIVRELKARGTAGEHVIR